MDANQQDTQTNSQSTSVDPQSNEQAGLLAEMNDLIASTPVPQFPEELVQELTEGIDRELADVAVTPEQVQYMRLGALLYIQSQVDEQLEEVIPDGLFEELDKMLDAQQITEEEIPPIVDYIYKLSTGNSLLGYAREELLKFLPYLKEQQRDLQTATRKALDLPEEQQQQFISLMEQDKFAEAQALLASK
jgi:hypothetical protein